MMPLLSASVGTFLFNARCMENGLSSGLGTTAHWQGIGALKRRWPKSESAKIKSKLRGRQAAAFRDAVEGKQMPSEEQIRMWEELLRS